MANEKEQMALVVAADDYLKKKEQQLTRWVQGGVAAEALRRFAVLEMQSDWKLRRCTPRSIYTSLLACATTGLIPGSLKGEAFLVPFNRNIAPRDKEPQWISEAKFLAGYKGLRKQALRTPVVKIVKSSVVYEAELDAFDIDLGTRNEVIHKPLLTSGDRGQIVGAYAWAQLSGGFRQIVWMARADLDKVKAFATRKVASPAWTDWEDRMFEKTVMRRLCGQLPMGDDYFNGVRIEARDEGVEDAPSAEEVIDILTDGEVSREVGEEMNTSLFSGVPPAAEQARQAGSTPPEVRTNPPPQTPAASTSSSTSSGAQQQRQTRQSRNRTIDVPANTSNASPAPSSSSASSGPTPPAGSSSSSGSSAGPGGSPTQAGQSSGSPAAPAATSQTRTDTGSPTGPTPATSSGGSTSSPASAPSPAAPSAGSPTSAPTASTKSASATSPASSAAGPTRFADLPAGAGAPPIGGYPESAALRDDDEVTFGDVAGEPAGGDGFDTSFGEQQQPADRRNELMVSFRSWSAAHPDRDTVRANSDGWISIFRAWLAACGSRAELNEHKEEWINWTCQYYKASQRANPQKNIKEFIGDPEMDTVQDLFSRRRAELP